MNAQIEPRKIDPAGPTESPTHDPDGPEVTEPTTLIGISIEWIVGLLAALWTATFGQLIVLWRRTMTNAKDIEQLQAANDERASERAADRQAIIDLVKSANGELETTITNYHETVTKRFDDHSEVTQRRLQSIEEHLRAGTGGK